MNPTLQKMPLQYIWNPIFDVVAAALAKDAMTLAADEVAAAPVEEAVVPP